MMEHEFDYNREIRERVEEAAEAAEEAREEGIKKAIEIYLEMGVEGREAVRLTAAKFNISSKFEIYFSISSADLLLILFPNLNNL